MAATVVAGVSAAGRLLVLAQVAVFVLLCAAAPAGVIAAGLAEPDPGPFLIRSGRL